MTTMLELELTHACQLACAHCLTTSHPGAGHGSMTLEDWLRAVGQAQSAGFDTVQLIGGEPTASPHWVRVLNHALSLGLGVQVYSNLYAVHERAWVEFQRPGVRLATSYYSDDSAEHDAVTGKPGSHARTRGNIVKALELGIDLKVGIIQLAEGQRVEQAAAELRSLGLRADAIGIDRARAVGRTNPNPGTDAPVSELCGQCGIGKAAILPDGTVAPCVLGRALKAGNMRDGAALADILAGPRWNELMAQVPRPQGAASCVPDDSNDCQPARTEACRPAYNYAPQFPTVDLGLPRIPSQPEPEAGR